MNKYHLFLSKKKYRQKDMNILYKENSMVKS